MSFPQVDGSRVNYCSLVPLPMALDLILKRLASGYYRQVEAFKHDLATLRGNCELFNGDGSEYTTSAVALERELCENLQTVDIDRPIVGVEPASEGSPTRRRYNNTAWAEKTVNEQVRESITIAASDRIRAPELLDKPMSEPKHHLIAETILLPLVEKVRLSAAQVHDFGASVTILLHHSALLAVVRVCDAHSPTDDTPSLLRPIITLVADAH